MVLAHSVSEEEGGNISRKADKRRDYCLFQSEERVSQLLKKKTAQVFVGCFVCVFSHSKAKSTCGHECGTSP